MSDWQFVISQLINYSNSEANSCQRGKWRDLAKEVENGSVAAWMDEQMDGYVDILIVLWIILL